jgi:peptidoglycan hydrolase-like protein with peptidoglycan-binding domain
VNARPVVTALVVCLVLALSGWAKTAPKKVVRKASSKVAAKSVSKRKLPAKRYATRRYSAPAAPTNDRIRLVQQALIERGYLAGEPTGKWDLASTEALKKLEAEQRVKVDGKLDSKMLIVLGLGPRYDSNLNLPASPAFSGTVSADEARLDNFARLNNN